jgi:F-type H+-transporting ATPase subunit delta
MYPEPAARRYAEAAHLIAREEHREDAWRDGLQSLAALFGDTTAQRFFANSGVPVTAKSQLLEKALDGLPADILNLARLLLKRQRTRLAPQIAEAYQEIIDKENGVSHATVISAVTLSDDEQRAVQQKVEEMTGGTVIITTQVDETILGGLIVRIGDRLIDGSTRSRLLALRQRLAGARS